ncbi:MAG: hypothetical protein PWQ55_1304 [Chloroflexota bacterium]|nr:hypothetical protein [Chloroflexota bacterium]
MNWITLTTDFTEHDGYVGVMKGVIAGIAPQARVIDLSHTVAPQDVFQAALLLGRSLPYFPAGTVHVVVVDPGVGTARRGIAAQLGAQFFVGPDNGLLTLPYQQAQAAGQPVRIHALENPDYRLAQVSRTFHGRDIFAPAGAHLAAGVPLERFGAAVSDPVLLDIPQPRETAQGWEGRIIHVDAFGNLASNIRAETLADLKNIHIILKNIKIEGISATFGNKAQGELVAVFDSFGFLSICVVNGSAARQLGAGFGETLQIVRS